MKPTRRLRLLIALHALVSVLFMQFAMAAHACTAGEHATRQPHAAMANRGDAPCRMPDQDQHNLCKAHCERAAQSVDQSPQPAVHAPVLALLASKAMTDVHRPQRSLRGNALAIPVPEPPPALRFCVLRI